MVTLLVGLPDLDLRCPVSAILRSQALLVESEQLCQGARHRQFEVAKLFDRSYFVSATEPR